MDQTNTFRELLPQLVESYSLVPNGEANLTVRVEPHTNSPLSTQLRDGIQWKLPIAEIEHADSDNQVARATAACSELLMQRQDEARRFLEAVCYQVVQIRVRGDHHPEAMAKAQEKARQPLLVAINRVMARVEPVLTAELLANPMPVIRESVQRWVQESCLTIANQFLTALHMLVEMDVIGIIEWPKERVCKLHFFRHTIVQDRVEVQKSSKVERVARNTIAVQEWEQVHARNRYGIERHEHHVMNAEARELGQTRFPIPREYNNLLTRIPEWVRPVVRVLEGDLILERIVQRTLRHEQWDSTPKLRNAYEIEPAILLGHFVLAGWGQHEVEREAFRRSREGTAEPKLTVTPSREVVQQVRESASVQFWSYAAAAAAVVMMLLSLLQYRVMLPLALLLSAAAIIGLWHSQQVRERANHREHDLIDCGYRVVPMALGLLAIQSGLFGILYRAWSVLGLALPLGLVALVVKNIAASRENR